MWEIQNTLALPPQQFHFQAIVLVMMMTSDVNSDDFGQQGTRNKHWVLGYSPSSRIILESSFFTSLMMLYIGHLIKNCCNGGVRGGDTINYGDDAVLVCWEEWMAGKFKRRPPISLKHRWSLQICKICRPSWTGWSWQSKMMTITMMTTSHDLYNNDYNNDNNNDYNND